MPFIVLIGCDGSGKSAVITGVSEQLRTQGINVSCGHWRPKAFARSSQGTVAAAVDDPHGRPSRGLATSILKLGWLWLNWWVAWWTGLRKASRNGVVLFDRFHGDLWVDPKRYLYGGPLWLARMATQIMPQPDLILFLDAPPEVLLTRKQEVSRGALENSRRRYLELGRWYRRFLIIDVTQSLEQVVEVVMERIKDARRMDATSL